MPYFPYSRQSKKKSHRGAITARMIANILTVAGVDHVITIDLHASQMQGFFKCPVDNLVAEPILARWIRQYVPGWREAVVVSKNPGGTKRVTSLADALKLNFGIITTDTRKPNMGNSVMGSMVFESMGIDGTMERGMPGDLEFEAEARICSTELLNDRHTRTQGERQVEHTEERHMEHSSRNPTRSRATSNVQNTVVNRLL
ncbi:ribose-phosphate pyrophosphokinase 1, partial [Cryomyces antarcticus]